MPDEVVIWYQGPFLVTRGVSNMLSARWEGLAVLRDARKGLLDGWSDHPSLEKATATAQNNF